MTEPTDLSAFIRGAADSLERAAKAENRNAQDRLGEVAAELAYPRPVEDRDDERARRVLARADAVDRRLVAVLGSPNLALALAHQWRETTDRHYLTSWHSEALDADIVTCAACSTPEDEWPCPDIVGTAKVAEHVTQALGEAL